MSRSVAWRRTCSDAVFWRQTQALNATIYILRETGPTGFLLQEEGETKPVKVFLGDPHNCTCSTFKKERDLCKHICWLILKKFRVQQTNPVSWQLGLVEREINDMLFGATVRHRKTPVRRWNGSGPPGNTGYGSDGRPVIQQREIGEDDCCPICQDELLSKHLPVTYCKFGCGNSIHIKCMKIWADHQKSSGDTTIKCPFCREDFGPIELLKQESRTATGPSPGGRMDRHLGTTCQSCRTSPIEGKCYRCSVCADYHLCQSCFNTQIHTSHPFEYRQKRNQRWKVAQRTYGAVLPEAVANDLLNRELTDGDYELLTQLDSTPARNSDIPESVVHQFPLEKVREGGALLVPGKQCRVCLRGFEIGQFVRKLPRCKHKFHQSCIDNWLLHSHPTCPIDGQIVWDPVTAQAEEEGQRSGQRGPPRIMSSDNPTNQENQLIIPGVGIVRQTGTSSAGTSVDRAANARRRVAQQGRLQNRPEEVTVLNPLRASFTLNGTSVSGNEEQNVEEQVTTTTFLPGGRLLGRAQSRRASLNQQLADLSINSAPNSASANQESANIASANQEPESDSRAASGISVSSTSSGRLVNGIHHTDGNDSRQRRHMSTNPVNAARLPKHPQRKERHTIQQNTVPPDVTDVNGAQLMERLQLFTDLYLGNDPRAELPVGSTSQKPNRPVRRQLSNPMAAAASRRDHQRREVRRRRTNEFELEGNAYANLTLRDLL